MKAANRVSWASVAVLLCVLPLFAHHSFTAEFDGSKTVTLRGVVSKVDWINPHIFLYLDVKDDTGKTTTWALQSLPPLFFRGSGLTKDMLLEQQVGGDRNGDPAKDGTHGYGFMTYSIGGQIAGQVRESPYSFNTAKRSAKPLYVGSTPTRASNTLQETFRKAGSGRHHDNSCQRDQDHPESRSITLIHAWLRMSRAGFCDSLSRTV
jgi:Family of unknown function (DUF6152)